MYKLICTDIDGTIVNSECEIKEEDRRALRKAYEMGVKVAIVSGRFRAGVNTVARQLGFPVWKSCFNGIYCETEPGCEVFSKLADNMQLLKALKIVREYGAYPLIFALDDWYVEGKGIFYERQKTLVSPTGDHIGNLEDVLLSGTKVYKLIAKSTERSVLDNLKIKLEEANIDSLKYVFSNQLILEIVPDITDKGIAVQAFSSHMGISTDEVISFGDFDNDAGLIEKAGLGIAMGNGTPIAKGKARFITKTVDECGVAYALEKFLF